MGRATQSSYGTFKPDSPSVARYIWCGIRIYGALIIILYFVAECRVPLSRPNIFSILVISM